MLSQAGRQGDTPGETGAVVYLEVKDMTAALQVATSMGATVEIGPEVDEPSGAVYADIVDPFGLRIGLVQESPSPTASDDDAVP